MLGFLGLVRRLVVWLGIHARLGWSVGLLPSIVRGWLLGVCLGRVLCLCGCGSMVLSLGFLFLLVRCLVFLGFVLF